MDEKQYLETFEEHLLHLDNLSLELLKLYWANKDIEDCPFIVLMDLLQSEYHTGQITDDVYISILENLIRNVFLSFTYAGNAEYFQDIEEEFDEFFPLLLAEMKAIVFNSWKQRQE